MLLHTDNDNLMPACGIANGFILGMLIYAILASIGLAVYFL